MFAGKENRMSKSEITELMELKGWSRTKLAASLDLTETTVNKWMSDSRSPSGPASILMRMWLEEERRKLVTAG